MLEAQREKQAVVLLSGGLDSTTALYAALRDGFRPHALTMDYGQRHKKETECARWIAAHLGIEIKEISIELPWKGSALLDTEISLPKGRSLEEMSNLIPITYVPARNTIFLSFALSWAEVLKAEAIYIGANSLDYSGYPDCRPEYFQAMQEVFSRATKATVEGHKIRILAPLLRMTKAGIIRLGHKLQVPFEHTWSCYQGEAEPCGECDSCLLREKGFREAELTDPLMSHQQSAGAPALAGGPQPQYSPGVPGHGRVAAERSGAVP